MYITTEELKDFISSYISAAFRFTDRVREIDTKRMDRRFIFRHHQIKCGREFDGKNTYAAVFTSDEDFDLYHTKAEFFDRLFLGSGNILQDFEVQDEIIIPANTFDGEIEEGNILTFQIDGFISQRSLVSVIEDAMTEVDNYTKSLMVFKHDLEIDHLPLFFQHMPLVGNYAGSTSTPVFREVKLATKRISMAILIERKLFPMANGADLTEGFNKSLRETAEKDLRQLAERYRYGKVSSVSLSDIIESKELCGQSLMDIYNKYNCKREVRCGC